MQVIVILASSLRTRWTASLLILYLYSRFFPFIYCVSISWPLPSAERHGRASPSPGGSFFRISLQRYCFLFEFFFCSPQPFLPPVCSRARPPRREARVFGRPQGV